MSDVHKIKAVTSGVRYSLRKGYTTEEECSITLNDYNHKQPHVVYVHCNDGCDQYAIVSMDIRDAEKWFTECLSRIRDEIQNGKCSPDCALRKGGRYSE